MAEISLRNAIKSDERTLSGLRLTGGGWIGDSQSKKRLPPTIAFSKELPKGFNVAAIRWCRVWNRQAESAHELREDHAKSMKSTLKP